MVTLSLLQQTIFFSTESKIQSNTEYKNKKPLVVVSISFHYYKGLAINVSHYIRVYRLIIILIIFDHVYDIR